MLYMFSVESIFSIYNYKIANFRLIFSLALIYQASKEEVERFKSYFNSFRFFLHSKCQNILLVIIALFMFQCSMYSLKSQKSGDCRE